MGIQWFPGHMHKARKKIAEVMSQIDVVIELLDARLPLSSQNPLARKLSANKPIIILLNKVDLADPSITQQWLDYFDAQPNIYARRFSALDKKHIPELIKLCKEKGAQRISQGKTARLLVLGIPNVGKSTLLNHLVGRTAAKVGNQPAVTRDQMRVRIDDDLSIVDTPGILWPKIEMPESSYRLAASGAIRETAFDIADVALFAADFMLKNYQDQLIQRYELEDCIADIHEDEQFLEAAAQRRGCRRKGGGYDLYKISEIFLTEIRNGKLGKISFERPSDFSSTHLEDSENSQTHE